MSSRRGTRRSALLRSALVTVLCGCFGAAEPSAAETVLYVSSERGSDSGPGSATAPLRTLQACLDRWDGRERFTCRGAGVFHESLVVARGGPGPEARNRIIAWDTDGDGRLDDETFVLDGQRRRNVAIRLARPKPSYVEIAYLTLQDFEPSGGCGDGGELSFVSFPWGRGGSGWWLHHNTFRRMGAACDASRSGGSYIAIQPSGASDLIVEDNTFEQIGGWVMRYVGGRNIAFRNNRVEVVASGIKAWSADLEGLQITGNDFRCDGNGANPDAGRCYPQVAVGFSDDAQGGSVRGNTFEGCAPAIVFSTNARFGTRDNANHLVEGNAIRSSAPGCMPDSPAITIGDCSEASEKSGAEMEVRDVRFRNNLIARTNGVARGAAIVLASGHPHEFSNDLEFSRNTIHGYHTAVRVDGCGGRFAHGLRGVQWTHNVFSAIGDSVAALGPRLAAPPQDWRSDHNSFGPRALFRWPDPLGLDAWRARSGPDAHSRECVAKFASPADLRLDRADACARDRGADPARATDRQRDGGLDPA